MEWLAHLGAEGWLARWFTVSTMRDPALHAEVQLARHESGVSSGTEGLRIVGSATNTMMFFDALDVAALTGGDGEGVAWVQDH
jgi:hypothetical protein